MRPRDRWWNVDDPYRYRNDTLRHLGFDSYQAYLKSPLWADIRARVLALGRAGGLCEKCVKRPATQVHHRAYDPATLAGDNLNALNALCGRCHYRAERPKDHGQSRYDRLMAAGQFMLTRKHPRERHLSRLTRGASRPAPY